MELITIDDAAIRLKSTPERIMTLIADGTLLAFAAAGTKRVLVDQIFLCGERIARADQ